MALVFRMAAVANGVALPNGYHIRQWVSHSRMRLHSPVGFPVAIAANGFWTHQTSEKLIPSWDSQRLFICPFRSSAFVPLLPSGFLSLPLCARNTRAPSEPLLFPRGWSSGTAGGAELSDEIQDPERDTRRRQKSANWGHVQTHFSLVWRVPNPLGAVVIAESHSRTLPLPNASTAWNSPAAMRYQQPWAIAIHPSANSFVRSACHSPFPNVMRPFRNTHLPPDIR
jgi:hypothetical protein